MEKSTRLRYVAAKEVDTIIQWTNMLPYKIEIKGGLVYQSKRWYLFFVPGDTAKLEIKWGILD